MTAEPTLSESDFLRLRPLLRKSHGIDLSYYTESFLGRRIGARMRMLGVGADEYFARLAADGLEREALVASLTINVTEFFRDAGVYKSLHENVIPKILGVGPKRIAAWSAGCATGQEPYTLAMTLDGALRARRDCSYVVHASDISPRQLEAARAASYPRVSAAGAPEAYTRYFVPHDADQVTIDPRIKASVRFFQYDLSTAAPPIADLDLILCRNVMIYFASEAKLKLIESFYRALAPGGFLVLGGAEVILQGNLFRTFDPRQKIYQAVPRSEAGAR